MAVKASAQGAAQEQEGQAIMHTEAEAKTKQCRMRAAANSKCSASSCMMWRWWTVTTDPSQGYCGLAGLPLYVGAPQAVGKPVAPSRKVQEGSERTISPTIGSVVTGPLACINSAAVIDSVVSKLTPRPFICCEHDEDCERDGQPCMSHPEFVPPAAAPIEKQPKLYCFDGQAASARALLLEAGLRYRLFNPVVNPVKDAYGLKGISGGVFVIVEGHSISCPVDIYTEATRAGLLIITISDHWLRLKIGRVAGGYSRA